MDNVLRQSIANPAKYLFECPACGLIHFFYDEPPMVWNQSWSKPTLNRILVFGTKATHCQAAMIDGVLYYDMSSKHRLRGKDAAMIPWD